MEKKEVYQQKMQKHLEDIQLQIKQLKVKVDKEYIDKKSETTKIINDLEDKKEQLKSEFESLTNASGDAWSEIKMGVERSWVELESAFKAAKNKYK